MDIESILEQSRTRSGAQSGSKKRALEDIATLIGEQITDIDRDALFEALIAREKVGTTAVGQGVAIPHCRFGDCDSIIGVLLILESGIDFAAYDHEPVDIIFALIVPEEETTRHHDALAMIATALDSERVRNELRSCRTDEELYRAALNQFSPFAQSA